MMKKEINLAFKKRFQEENEYYIRSGGRFEILGNHTDHNHGECIAATCDMSIYSGVKKEDDNHIIISSYKYGENILSLDELEIKENEKGKSNALIRGVAYYLKEHGYQIGGFKAFTISTIFKGAGVSSSAAFELLIGQIFNELYNDNKINRITLAKAGQFAENVYYGKKCGLLDQIGVSIGGFVHIDFKDIENPKIEKLNMNLKGYRFILVNTGGNHSEMSALYSKIPEDMKHVSEILKVDYLRESSLDELIKNKDNIEESLFLRALHFYSENQRVRKAITAIKNNDIKALINYINESRNSSANNLKNMVATSYEGSPLEACDYVDEITNYEGAAKINGGGFAGSIVSLIPEKYLSPFLTLMKNKYGEDNVYQVTIDQVGVGKF